MEMREQSLEQQDQILNDEHVDVQNVSEVSVAESSNEESEQPKLSKEAIVAAIVELTNVPIEEIGRDDVARLKQQFYAIRKQELEQEKNEFMEKGNEESAFAPKEDELETKFKESLNIIKEKKAALLAEQEAERQKNFEKKNQIIDEIKTLAADTDNVNRLFPRFKELQQEFKAIGEVPPVGSAFGCLCY